jgi:hypothetical protein
MGEMGDTCRILVQKPQIKGGHVGVIFQCLIKGFCVVWIQPFQDRGSVLADLVMDFCIK